MPMTERQHLKTMNYLDGHKDHRIKMPFESYTLLYSSGFHPLISLFPLQIHKTDIVKIYFIIVKHFRVLPTMFVYLGQFLKLPISHSAWPACPFHQHEVQSRKEVSTVRKLHSGFPLVPSCPILILYISPMLLRTT